jgi:hypothetical protein
MGRGGAGDKLRRLRLKAGEDFVDLLHIGELERQDAHAVARHDVDQPVALEPDQRLADGRATDHEESGEILLEDLEAGRKGVVEDPVLDAAIDGLGRQRALTHRLRASAGRITRIARR